MSLTAAQVTAIRTAGYTDTHWARVLRTGVKTIRHARVGLSFKHVPTPPDLTPRMGTGSVAKGASWHVHANKRQRWSYFKY